VRQLDSIPIVGKAGQFGAILSTEVEGCSKVMEMSGQKDCRLAAQKPTKQLSVGAFSKKINPVEKAT
jgi:hypothetical protein